VTKQYHAFREGVVPPKKVLKKISGTRFIWVYERPPKGIRWCKTQECWKANFGGNGYPEFKKAFRTLEEASAWREQMRLEHLYPKQDT
jgi:hypothetical protein